MNYAATSTPAINHRNGDLAFLLAHPVSIPTTISVRDTKIMEFSREVSAQLTQEKEVIEALSGSAWMNVSEVMHITGFCRVTVHKASTRLLEKKKIEKMMVRVRGRDKSIFRAVAGD